MDILKDEQRNEYAKHRAKIVQTMNLGESTFNLRYENNKNTFDQTKNQSNRMMVPGHTPFCHQLFACGTFDRTSLYFDLLQIPLDFNSMSINLSYYNRQNIVN